MLPGRDLVALVSVIGCAVLLGTGDAEFYTLSGALPVGETGHAGAFNTEAGLKAMTPAPVSGRPDPVYGWSRTADLKLCAFWVLAMTALRWAATFLVFNPLGRVWRIHDVADTDPKTGKKLSPAAHARLVEASMAKWSEAAWMSFYYLGIVAFEYAVIVPEGWVFNPTQWWAGAPHMMSAAVKMYYLVGMGAFWTHSLVVLLIDERKKDFYEMLVHHSITIWMVFISYHFEFVHIGVVIMMNQDVSDVVLFTGKLFNYAGEHGSAAAAKIANVLFVLFVASWVPSRHVSFCYILWSIYDHMPGLINFGDAPGQIPPLLRSSTGALLVLLQLLCIFWFVLIIRMARKVLGGQALTDNREAPTTSAAAAPKKGGDKTKKA